MMNHLAFKTSNIFLRKDDESVKYRTELLKEEDNDYKFMLRSIVNNKPFENHAKILHIIKVNPVDRNEVAIMNNKYLLLNGVRSNKVNDILTQGYPRTEYVFHDYSSIINFYQVSSCFNNEIRKGFSYCEVDNVVKKLSFVFVVISTDEDATTMMCNTKQPIEIAEEVVLKRTVVEQVHVNFIVWTLPRQPI